MSTMHRELPLSAEQVLRDMLIKSDRTSDFRMPLIQVWVPIDPITTTESASRAAQDAIKHLERLSPVSTIELFDYRSDMFGCDYTLLLSVRVAPVKDSELMLVIDRAIFIGEVWGAQIRNYQGLKRDDKEYAIQDAMKIVSRIKKTRKNLRRASCLISNLKVEQKDDCK